MIAAAAILAVTAAPLFAQQGAPVSSDAGETWLNALDRIEPGKLALILIFGSGIIGTLGYSVAGIIRAVNGSRDEETNEELSTRLDALEDRLAQLEAQARTAVPDRGVTHPANT
jgi:hypothetical protein